MLRNTHAAMRLLFLSFLFLCAAPAAQVVQFTPEVLIGDTALSDDYSGPTVVYGAELFVATNPTGFAGALSTELTFVSGLAADVGYGVFITPLVLYTTPTSTPLYVAAGPSAALYEELTGETTLALGVSAEIGVLLPVGDALLLSGLRYGGYSTETPRILGTTYLRFGLGVPL